MKHFKHLWMLLAAMLLSINVWGADADATFSYGSISAHAALTTQTSNDVTLTWGAGTNTSNSPQHNRSGYVQLYGSNTLTISADVNISSIVFTMSGSYTMDACKVNEVFLTNNTWSGAAKSVTIVNTASGQTRIKSIAVYLTSEGSSDQTAV